MADKPTLFSAPMVRALLDGRKTQTRRVIKDRGDLPEFCAGRHDDKNDPSNYGWEDCERGEWITLDQFHSYNFVPIAVGDRLWVREAHSLHNAHGTDRDDDRRWGPWGGLPTALSPDKEMIAYYREGFDRCGFSSWRPSIHMPRWASRLTLIVTDVRVQRLQDISRGDAMAEGCPFANMAAGPNPCDWFADLWGEINGPEAWDANPWVAAYSFRVIRANIDSEDAAHG